LTNFNLVKQFLSCPGLSERFELYANGYEIVNAYTELNDPAKQHAMFSLQRNIDKCFDDVDNVENKAFVRALEYGLPPTAGWGVGIDRLVMLMTGQRSIRQVILFPTLRPASTTPTESEESKNID
jgi:lysyl-tRNA synthetase class 2